jgi:alanine-glyoxylate transaminase/serine-glyoxylate transaminase/serine-pyruvate transaminase
VYRALATPIIGHLDPSFLSIMDEISSMLRAVFKTRNRLTIPLSGTGSSGMEACFVNVLEPGEKAIVCVNGLFGERMVDVASRCGANVVRLDEPWGRSFSPERVVEFLKKHRDAKLLAIVHAETSTGVLQPLREIGEFMKEGDTLLVVDCVTSLGGCDVRVDEWGIDLCYSATQKCLSIPPGLSPLTVSDKALERIKGRKTKVQSWYLDLGMIASYWGEERVYHHTAPISMLYALREGLRLILEEGLEERYERHRAQGSYLQSSLTELGFKLFAEEGSRLPMLTSVLLPDGVDDAETRKTLLRRFGIEVGAGLGATKGKIWRIGLMGETARRESTERLLSALRELLG